MNCAHRCDREASRQPEKIPKTGLSCENDAEALRETVVIPCGSAAENVEPASTYCSTRGEVRIEERGHLVLAENWC